MKRLLLFCMVGMIAVVGRAQTQPELRKGVSVKMAVTTNAVAVPDADRMDALVVAVTARGVVYLEVTTMTPAQLTAKIRPEVAAHPGKRVYVKGDARAPYSAMTEVLDALRAAGVTAPMLLTDQPGASGAYPVPPMGLEVLLAPPAPNLAKFVTVKAGAGPAADAEMKQQAAEGRPIVLRADGQTLFGDVLHAADVCRGAGARVFLIAGGK